MPNYFLTLTDEQGTEVAQYTIVTDLDQHAAETFWISPDFAIDEPSPVLGSALLRIIAEHIDEDMKAVAAAGGLPDDPDETVRLDADLTAISVAAIRDAETTRLISSAAEAVEEIDPDELEDHAAKQRKIDLLAAVKETRDLLEENAAKLRRLDL